MPGIVLAVTVSEDVFLLNEKVYFLGIPMLVGWLQLWDKLDGIDNVHIDLSSYLLNVVPVSYTHLDVYKRQVV